MSKIIDGKVGGELWRRERGLQKTALITGINGQDGSYLAEFLLSQRTKLQDSIVSLINCTCTMVI